MSPLVAAVVSLALPVIAADALLAVLCFALGGEAKRWAVIWWARLFYPAITCAFALVSLGIYHMLVQGVKP
jgi:hypothetical protein